MQLTKILIGMMLAIFIAISYTLFMADGITTYSNTLTDDYNSSGLARIQTKYGELNESLSRARSGAENVSSSNPLANFIDLYFGRGLQAVKIAVVGGEVVHTVVDVTVQETTGNYAIGAALKNMIYAMVIVVLFVGILLYVILGRERI